MKQIQQANTTAYLAANQISESINKLGLVSLLRESVESSLGDSFQSMYRNHSQKLEEISQIISVLQELLSLAQDLEEKANMNLTQAMEIVSEAKNVSGQRRREAQSARDSASNALSDAMRVEMEAENALNTATEFKVSLHAS